MGDFIINNKTVASLMISNKEVIRIADGQTILWEKTTPQVIPTLVDYVQTSAPTPSVTGEITDSFINTGVYTTNDTVVKIVHSIQPYTLLPLVKCGNGVSYIIYDNSHSIDFNINSHTISKEKTVDYDGYSDITCGNHYITDNLTQTTISGGTLSIQNNPIYINLSKDMYLRSLEIWQNNVKVYDGHAAVLNDVYGVYESVSGNFVTHTISGISITGGNLADDEFYFEAREDNSSFTNPSGTKYSTDRINWTSGSTTHNMDEGDRVYVRTIAQNGTWVSGDTFVTNSGTFNIGGKISSLLYGKQYYNMPLESHCQSIFSYCSGIVDASKFEINVDLNDVEGAFMYAFAHCTGLVYGPILKPEVLSQSCYYSMFWDCTSLLYPSELPARYLNDYCYGQMYEGCSSMQIAPLLLFDAFDRNGCCIRMFQDCVNLNSVTCLAQDIGTENETYYWLNNVASAGTFTKSPFANNWPSGAHGIPSRWTVVNEQQVAVPSISYSDNEGECGPAGDGYVTIECPTSGSNIYYCISAYEDCWLNEPVITNRQWQLYVSPINVFANEVECENAMEDVPYLIEAYASKSGMTDSNYVKTSFTVEPYQECTEEDPCNDWEGNGYESYEDCLCSEHGDCGGDEPDCGDCNNWEECGYSSYEDCDCQVNGNNCPELTDCSSEWETLGYESEEDCDCIENDMGCSDDPCADVDCTDCENWECCGYASPEDCDCDVNGNCGEEVDCSDWENLGYSSEEDCNCQEYSVDCDSGEEEEPVEEEPEE